MSRPPCALHVMVGLAAHLALATLFGCVGEIRRSISELEPNGEESAPPTRSAEHVEVSTHGDAREGDATHDAETGASDQGVDAAVPLPGMDDDAAVPATRDAGLDPPPPPAPADLDCQANDVALHPLFTDHMVLQRGARVPVWGCAPQGQSVVVEMAGQRERTVADADGRWFVVLSPMDAGGPYTLLVHMHTEVALEDVLVGDVLLCSGQSNMLKATRGILHESAEIEAGLALDHLRLFKVPFAHGAQPSDVFAEPTKWRLPSADTIAGFSAACYVLGRELAAAATTPIGLVLSSQGGTGIDTWISADTLSTDPDFADEVTQVRAGSDASRATTYFNGMIAPLRAFPFAAVAWYQGEQNVGRSKQYQRLLSSLIADWRARFASPELPFLVVQLPRTGAPSSSPVDTNATWPGIREAQLVVSRSVAGVGLVVTADTGEIDPTTGEVPLHPLDKAEIGKRLARVAHGVLYRDVPVYTGPLYRSMSITGDRVRIRFDFAQHGLFVGTRAPGGPVVRTADGELTGFGIAGVDGHFEEAVAVIDGSDIVVSSRNVAAPVAVRYGWSDAPNGNLYNAEGLPASPFRTDTTTLIDRGR